MIIDADTWQLRHSKTEGLPVFISWKRLKEMIVGGQRAYSIEVGELGLMIRVNMDSYDERGKHALMDKQV